MGSSTAAKRLMLVVSFMLLLVFAACDDDANQGRLVANEVDALKDISRELGKKDWNFKVDPCSNDTSWNTPSRLGAPTYVNQVVCSCSGSACHVVNISLKGQDLAGVLPKSLVKLSYITTIDLTRNYLTGTIPPEWASLKLEYMSITVNQLSGPIPTYLGNFTTLTYLSIENNKFSGSVPAELGKLVNLYSLTLNSNNLTGKLPIELANLTNLTELRITDSNFSGRIPDYFHSWKKLQKLQIQGSGFEGPIPSNISVLSELIELRISDLGGEVSMFPSLENMINMKYLMLRNCNISGSIPSTIGGMYRLKTLDLSFNKLQGNIPSELQSLNLDYMYLTSNFLSGPIPGWIKTRGDINIDLSYNKFDGSSVPSTCNQPNLNLYRSSSRMTISNLYGNSSRMKILALPECLRNPCSKVYYSFHINCGGEETTVRTITYDDDDKPGGPAQFVASRDEWGSSSTGHFWFMKPAGDYIARNDTILRMTDAELYTKARLSAMSLTYYGRCLATGNYTVTLHFAEIIFLENNSFYSLGRRIFDVYIQETLVLKDFDIAEEANGTDKPLKKTFKHVSVTDIIEIRFFYAGKGTTAVPNRGSYGPLISAISVESEFSPPPDRKKIVKIVAASLTSFLALFFIASGFIWWRYHLANKPSREQVLRGLDLQTGVFTFRQIKAATNNFDPASKLGEGGFGSVYKGTLLDGTHIAVKQLSSRSKQGNREFVNEIGMISGLHHPNLVKLYGCCVERDQLILVYEYMMNNNLACVLSDDRNIVLDWPTRQRICIGIAKGLTFLHEGSDLRMVHRDIKATNVLLDAQLNPKISDFGLARLFEDESTHISTRIAGTIGYMAPEYALWGYLTYKADVYSFGVVALEIAAGRSNMKFQADENYFCLLDWALVKQQKGNVMDLVDPRLGTGYNKEEAFRMIRVALLCTSPSPALRPTMSEVVSMLEGSLVVQDLPPTTSMLDKEWMLQASKGRHSQRTYETSSSTNVSSPLLSSISG